MDRHETLPNRAHRPYSRGCAQNEVAMWVIAKMEKVPIDCHALLIIIPLSSGVGSPHSLYPCGDRDESRLSGRSSRLLAKSEDTPTWQPIRIISTILVSLCPWHTRQRHRVSKMNGNDDNKVLEVLMSYHAIRVG
ncbi:hypothetical protein Y032_0057g2811 [Ancylostoma ceylanicum]|uniref:Uncharacterized protein n=1 Tax=Ancylostoma ceylanicum TaxID=53326 RepID=A0A016U4G9_9BILA|nr:hypothetical protein Y032_0057g2811 [Ancylostoma ceylanicum]